MDEVDEIVRGLDGIETLLVEQGGFGIDGWCSARGKAAAASIERKGLVTSEVSGGEQYTRIDFTPTDLGIAVRDRLTQKGYEE
jgi:hypothetical protein